MDYTEYEKEVTKIRKENKKYLDKFTKWLQEKNLTDKTIKKHISNVTFYINDFLNYYEPQRIKAGCYCLDEYFSDFFIRKCMWSTANATKENAASLKKFYQCMYELKHIDKEDYDYLCTNIKENIKIWQTEVNSYNNQIYDDEYDW